MNHHLVFGRKRVFLDFVEQKSFFVTLFVAPTDRECRSGGSRVRAWNVVVHTQTCAAHVRSHNPLTRT